MSSFLFLDIDGVLNSASDLKKGIHLSNEKVILLNNIIQKTDVDVVVSSSWRVIYTLDSIKEMLYVTGLKHRHKIIDTTPILMSKSRGEEIAKWLKSRLHYDHYIIVDDECDFSEYQQQHHFIQVDHDFGLTNELAEMIINELS